MTHFNFDLFSIQSFNFFPLVFFILSSFSNVILPSTFIQSALSKSTKMTSFWKVKDPKTNGKI